MFTGIIREVGTITRVERPKGLIRLFIHAPKTAAGVELLESVAVQGVCLSVVSQRASTLVFELIPETHQLTTLGRVRTGARVNLEPSLTLTDRLNGHVVLGHIDGTGQVIKRRHLAGELQLDIRCEAELRPFLVPKGPIAVDGVSLTIGRRPRQDTFTIHLIPETLRQTTLAMLQVGERVNLEADYLAKLVKQFSSY